MNNQEHLQHEAVKQALKSAVENNPTLTLSQKQYACKRIDDAAKQADWLMELLRQCGYLI